MKWLSSVIAVLLSVVLLASCVGCSSSDRQPEDRAPTQHSDTTPTVTIDSTPPSSVANLVKTTPESDNTPTFAWSAASDAGSGVAYYLAEIDSGPFTNIGNVTTYTVTTALANGSHIFEVKAVDGAGNHGTPASLAFNSSSVPPGPPVELSGIDWLYNFDDALSLALSEGKRVMIYFYTDT